MTGNEVNKDEKDKQALVELEKQVDGQTVKSTQSATLPPKEATSSPSKTSVKPVKTGLLWATVVLIFILLAVAIGGGVWFYLQWTSQQQQQVEALNSEKAAIALQVTTMQRNSETMANQNNELLSRIDSLNVQLHEALSQINTNGKKLAEVSGRRPADWLLAEADYLVRMAGRKLWLEHDVKTAILMLQAADSRLENLADPSLLPVRQLVANDIQNLQQVNPISLASVAMSLSAMTQQINNLPLALPKLPEIVENAQQMSDSIGDWRSNLNKLWSFFVNDLVRYQPREQAIRPLLSQQQQWLVREQLRYSLLQAQSSVLMEDAGLYQQNIAQAMSMLIEHFELENVAVEQFVSSLQNLKQINIERVYPAALESSEPLKDILQQRIEGAFVNSTEPL
jgi:uroporphyrin-III C-methyltransferase